MYKKLFAVWLLCVFPYELFAMECDSGHSLKALEVMINLDDRLVKGADFIDGLEVRPNIEFVESLDSLSINSSLDDVIQIVGEGSQKVPSRIKGVEAYHWSEGVAGSGVSAANFLYSSQSGCTHSFSFSWKSGPHIVTLFKRQVEPEVALNDASKE